MWVPSRNGLAQASKCTFPTLQRGRRSTGDPSRTHNQTEARMNGKPSSLINFFSWQEMITVCFGLVAAETVLVQLVVTGFASPDARSYETSQQSYQGNTMHSALPRVEITPDYPMGRRHRRRYEHEMTDRRRKWGDNEEGSHGQTHHRLLSLSPT